MKTPKMKYAIKIDLDGKSHSALLQIAKANKVSIQTIIIALINDGLLLLSAQEKGIVNKDELKKEIAERLKENATAPPPPEFPTF